MNIHPSLDEVEAYQGEEPFVALSVSLLADTETPISAFQRMSQGHKNSFLLESVEGGDSMGRYSFFACNIQERFEFSDGQGVWIRGSNRRAVQFDDPLVPVQERLAGWQVWNPMSLPRFFGGAIGYLGYDCIQYFEDISLPSSTTGLMPEGVLFFADEVYIYDHLSHQLILVVHVSLKGDRAEHYRRGVRRLQHAIQRLSRPINHNALWPMPAPGPGLHHPNLRISANRSPEHLKKAISSAKKAIEAGEIFQAVISQRLTVEAQVDPLVLYRSLRALNPSPYMFYLDFGEFSVVGASPEVLVRLEEDRLLLRPIAGTRPRGDTEDADQGLEQELLNSEKEVAEHRMLVDLGRNDLGRIALPGSVEVNDLLHVERYSHVMHLVTDVTATISPDLDAFDVFRACFPAGTVSGAPKVRACEYISALEPDRRGIYAGAIGYFGVNGDMDTCIAIRTLVVQEGQVHVQAGAGVVYDSDPTLEHEECIHKAQSCLQAVGMALQYAAEEAA